MGDQRQWTWNVEATIPYVWQPGTPQERLATKNVNLQVIAATLPRAVSLVQARYDEVTFIKVMRDRHVEAVIVDG